MEFYLMGKNVFWNLKMHDFQKQTKMEVSLYSYVKCGKGINIAESAEVR